jgi:hypothetical protein
MHKHKTQKKTKYEDGRYEQAKRMDTCYRRTINCQFAREWSRSSSERRQRNLNEKI